MFSIKEVINGKLIPHIVDGPTNFFLEDISHLIVYTISEEYFCIINSYQNRCFLIPKNHWKGPSVYPAGFSEFAAYPNEPNREIDLAQSVKESLDDSVSFIIVLSYACNLRCKYCYQQCNPELSSEKISKENLDTILNVIEQYHNKHPEKLIDIELFGGEPLLPDNYNDIIRIFDFCVENEFPVTISTNGVNIPMYLKDLVIYSGLGLTINTTVDSITENEITRFSNDTGLNSEGSHILKSVYTLINNDVRVVVQANIDQHNIEEIGEMIDFYRKNGFLDNRNFFFTIARVDDRRFETEYDKIVSDTVLISKLLELNIKEPNIFYSFVKSTLALCRKLYSDFKQQEKKHVSNYCWVSAPLDKAFYIDADLDVFRCTFTVGRKEYSKFKFSLENVEGYKPPNRTYLDYDKCRKCPIGGYCSGGCALSADVDFERMCSQELDDFSRFLETIFYPKLKMLLDIEM